MKVKITEEIDLNCIMTFIRTVTRKDDKRGANNTYVDLHNMQLISQTRKKMREKKTETSCRKRRKKGLGQSICKNKKRKKKNKKNNTFD